MNKPSLHTLSLFALPFFFLLSCFKLSYFNFDIFIIPFVAIYSASLRLWRSPLILLIMTYIGFYIVLKYPSYENLGYLLRYISSLLSLLLPLSLAFSHNQSRVNASHRVHSLYLHTFSVLLISALIIFFTRPTFGLGFPLYTSSMLDRHVYGPALGFIFGSLTFSIIGGSFKFNSPFKFYIYYIPQYLLLLLCLISGLLTGSRAFLPIVFLMSLSAFVYKNPSFYISLSRLFVIRKQLSILVLSIVSLITLSFFYVSSIYPIVYRSLSLIDLFSGNDLSRSSRLSFEFFSSKLSSFTLADWIVGIFDPNTLTHTDQGLLFILLSFGLLGLFVFLTSIFYSIYSIISCSRFSPLFSHRLRSIVFAWYGSLFLLTALGGEVFLIPRFFLVFSLSLLIALFSIPFNRQNNLHSNYNLYSFSDP
ncbi:putative membrane protein [Synechococcus sp. M16.1]|nr:putative membrane protein [Synechococcus sp. M16.1]